MASNKKDWPQKLAERCRDVGWSCEIGGGGHYKVHNQAGKMLFTFATTPSSNPRVEQNALAEARRQGLDKLEAATAKLRENERVLKIVRDRIDADAKLEVAAMVAAGRSEPEEPASSEVDVRERPPTDPPFNETGRSHTLRRAPSKMFIDGANVVASQPAVLPNIYGDWAMPSVSEILLDDGRTVYQCNSSREPECTAWAYNGISVRSHLRIHSTTAIAKRATQAMAAERDRFAAEIIRRERNVATPHKIVDSAAHLAAIEGVMEQMADAFASVITGCANAQRQFDALRTELKKLADMPVTDEETLAKAAKFDALKGLMQ